MGIDHGGGNVAVPEQFLDRAQILPPLKQMRGKTMAQRVGAGRHIDTSRAIGKAIGFLDVMLIQMMPFQLPIAGIPTEAATGEHILPNPGIGLARRPSRQRVRHVHRPLPTLPIQSVLLATQLEMSLQRCDRC